MTNLFEETVCAMVIRNKTWDDVAWVGGNDFYFDIDLFIKAAKATDYDSGYGGQEVAEDLVVCFNDGSWLSRFEYDGSEAWTYNHYPHKPSEKFEGNLKLTDPERGKVWASLKSINSEEEWW